MIPGSWFALASFFALVAPGVLYDLLASRRRVQRQETALRELGRVILASLIFTAVGLGAAAAASAVRPTTFMGLSTLAFGTRDDLQAASGAAAATISVALAVSLGAAWAFERLRGRGQSRTITDDSGWRQALRGDLDQQSQTAYVRVRLLGGSTYWGRVRSYTADFELADRELVLAPPLFAKPPGGPSGPLPDEWQRLVIHGAQVASMAVAYVPFTAPGTPDRPQPADRLGDASRNRTSPL